jgi:hypothetical protein
MSLHRDPVANTGRSSSASGNNYMLIDSASSPLKQAKDASFEIKSMESGLAM